VEMNEKPAKIPTQPVKPTLPYFKFSNSIWDNLQTHNPFTKSWELGKVVARMWRNLSDAEKKPYFDAYEAERAEYERALKLYQSSPAFHSQFKGNKYGSEEGFSISEPPVCRTNPMAILDKDDLDFYDHSYPIKYNSYIRFMKNQQLMSVIFSDLATPQPPIVDHEERLCLLKERHENLKKTLHNLNSEIDYLKNTHEFKKRKYAVMDDIFKKKIKKLKFKL